MTPVAQRATVFRHPASHDRGSATTEFLDHDTADIFAGIDSQQARNASLAVLHGKAAALLDRINAATRPADLRIPNSYRLQRLEGDRADQWSVSIDDQYRIVFDWVDGRATNVEITDCHERHPRRERTEPMVIPKQRRPITPGQVLREDFIEPLGMTQGRVAEALDVDRSTVNEIINARRDVTPEMALRLGHVFGTSPEYWMRLQLAVNLFDATHSPAQAEVDRLPVLVADAPS